MAILSITRVESRSDHTPPGTPSTKNDSEGLQIDPTSNSCSSKSCVNKMDKTVLKDQKSKEKVISDSEDTSSDSSDTSEEDTSSSSESDTKRSRRKSKSKKKRSKKSKKKDKKSKNKKVTKVKIEEPETKEEEKKEDDKAENISTETPPSDGISTLKSQLISQGFDMSDKHNSRSLKLFLHSLTKKSESEDESVDSDESDTDKKEKMKVKRASKVEFKRLDEIWDDDLYDYKLKETSDEQKTDEFEEYIFTVRRKFDNEGHYEETVVDIKSQPLKECLQLILANVEGISLVEDTPHMMPNMLFLFLEEFRQYVGELKQQRKNAEKRKVRKLAALKEKHLKKLVEYLDKDFDETKKTLYPLLKSGRITFELLWALYKPNTLAYTSTYGDDDHPRAYKIESIYKHRNFSRGTYYEISGKYLDYNGKHFGSAHYATQVNAFQGTRKITSLACYPLQYHTDPEKLRSTLLERGKKFLTLAGQHYQSCKGMAFVKKNDNVLKVNVNGRIMIDHGTFRRINPNYLVADVEARIIDLDEDKCCCDKKSTGTETFFRLLNLDKASVVAVDPKEQENLEQDIDSAEKEKDLRNTFTEEELLVASPVVLGFSFSEKCWLEFTVSSIGDVKWNDGAFDSLVLPEKHKSIVKALVSAHGLHAAKGFDDIIAGKGKGLVAVLHGRPGLGKTLTCEAVSDLLKRPLYTVSAGDLGTNPTQLEAELQAILDIAHTWNAVLLLDEADVFLEERSVHDVHRNALVSIFLRLLEYFQGILFLTTNRVATFDEAFVSRIHLSLRYNELTFEAKRSVWKTFVEKVRVMEGTEIGQITEKDFNHLARQDMNGRQIKNLVKTAQALALHEETPMSMEHINRVIDVAKSFEMDLKGGSGYSDAMRSYS